MSILLNKSVSSLNRFLSIALFSFIVACAVPSISFAQSEPSVSIEAPITTVNINTASAEDIAAHLKGIGLKKAKAIVQWRDEYGNFSSLESLADVKGIGDKTIELNRSKISL